MVRQDGGRIETAAFEAVGWWRIGGRGGSGWLVGEQSVE